MNSNILKETLFWKIVWILVLVSWCVFIFSNSIQTAEKSSARSNGVVEIVEKTVEKMNLDVEITDHGVRKSAHFFEFYVLGTILSLNCLIWKKHTDIRLVLTAFFGLIIALTDETLQLLSNGRSCSVTDVWLDFSAVVLSHLFFYIAFVIIKCKINRKSL